MSDFTPIEGGGTLGAYIPGDKWGYQTSEKVRVDLNDHEARLVDVEASGSGDVVGPASATDNAIARYDSTTGKLLQASGITIADAASGTLAGSNSGDVTLAGSPNYLTLAAQVITRALIDLTAHITGRLPFANLVAATGASKLLGRGSASGGGNVEEITLGSGMAMTGTVLSATGSGDVTGQSSSVDGEVALFSSTTGKVIKRATGSGIVRVSSGVYGTPGAVNLGSEVTGDLPLANIVDASGQHKLLGRFNSGSGVWEELTIGSGLDDTGGTLTASGGGGGAPDSAQYVTLATSGGLTSERVLTPGPGITMTDAGAGGAITVTAAGVGIPKVTVKPSDESVTSNATVQDDDHLLQAVGASQVWVMEWMVFFDGAAAGDIKVNIGVPSGSTYFLGGIGPATTIAAQVGDLNSWATGSSGFDLTFGAGASSVVNVVKLSASITTSVTTGNVVLKWAQGTSSGTATKVWAGSYLTAVRVS